MISVGVSEGLFAFTSDVIWLPHIMTVGIQQAHVLLSESVSAEEESYLF